ncbi:hypothetical protein LC613_05445 [Nostoc sphaeroides CHAB 2801]|nr:hypothetical protein [Nostoc sphaeroides]MCC5627621.1 hypothetical protein [Nostoc sphaeroides CHAB 2801]
MTNQTALSTIPHNLAVIQMVGNNTSNGINFCQLGGGSLFHNCLLSNSFP